MNSAAQQSVAESTAPATTVGAWNLANGLTLVRLLLVPVFAALFFSHGGQEPSWRTWAGVVFGISLFADRLDGELARKRQVVTDVGKIADPIVDKALIGTALVGLSIIGELPWWVTAFVLAREVGVTLLRFWVIRHGVIPASPGGKLKTLVQGIAIGLYVLVLPGWLASLRAWVMAVAVIVTVVTGLDYVQRAVRLRSSGRRVRNLA